MPDLAKINFVTTWRWQRFARLPQALACAAACMVLLAACDLQDTAATDKSEAYAHYLRIRSNQMDSIAQASHTFFAERKIPAAVTAIINRGDILRWVEHAVDDVEGNHPAREDTVFQIAALSRVFTAIIAQNLIQDGTLDPHASLIAYLPAQLSEESTRRLQGITIANLMHHQSGFPMEKNKSNPDAVDSQHDPLSEEDLWQFLNTVELVATPGTQLLDTAWDYTVLGYVLELVSGSSYSVLLRKFVTGPFGLVDTSIRPLRSGSLRMATGYQLADRTHAGDTQKTDPRLAAMGLYSTASDVSRLMILQMKSYQRYAHDKLLSPLLTTTNPVTVSADLRQGYGLSIRTIEYKNRMYDVYVRNGEADGFAASYLFIPGLDVGVVTLASSDIAWVNEQQELIVSKILSHDLPPSE